ncbi:ferredoxin [Candidatus Blastococcus massiliensis]|uniref:ferredoxin n=1 Tax=Candidatus Blastococcus massiliensis TaxID=1470358 RepID=UPI0004B53C3B|nr:ferredoxin [Candidatus Blastococcus massiliensis]
MRIVLDENKCSSLGMCESVAPDFFEVRDDGALELLNPTPSGDQRALMEEAVAACPTSALSIEE